MRVHTQRAPGPGKGTPSSRLVSSRLVPPRLRPPLISLGYTLPLPTSLFPQSAQFLNPLLSAAFHSVMSSADAASASPAPSPSTSASLPSSTPGTGQVDPPPELHALHPTPSTHVPVHSPTDAVSAVLDSRVGDLATDVCENSFMIVEGESQDDSVDDAIHETVDVQGREGVMVMDNGDDGQQWFPEHENHELKRVKVRLTH
jgi:hypothetical protein